MPPLLALPLSAGPLRRRPPTPLRTGNCLEVDPVRQYVPTGGNLGNAKWPEDEVCSICMFPLARPSEDERYAWPFSGNGTDFTTVACVRGHAFHKGCLRGMMRHNQQDTKCPDCRTPMFAEVRQDVSRPSPEEVERERRQAEERARDRAERERDDALERRRNAAPDRHILQGVEYEETPANDDHAVQWAFFVKDHVPTAESIWNATRAFFNHHMSVEWPGDNPVGNWGQRLDIQVLHDNTEPRDLPAQTNLLAFTRCRFRLHLPAAVAPRFVDWLTVKIDHWGYVDAMWRVLGIRVARQAGPAVAWTFRIFGIATMHSQERALLSMTWPEYQEWLPFQQRAADA